MRPEKVVTLRWEPAGVEKRFQLWDAQDSWTGRLQWACVKKAFDAETVKLLPGGTPSLSQERRWQGYTEKLFKAGSMVPVTIIRNASGLAMEVSEDEDARNAFIGGRGNNHLARHVQSGVSVNEPKDCMIFSTTEDGLKALLKDAYTDCSKTRQQEIGALVPLCAFEKRNMTVALPRWCGPCKQEYTVENLIRYAVQSIAFIWRLTTWEYGTAKVSGDAAQGFADYLVKIGGSQGGVVIMVVDGPRIYTHAYQGQVLALMSALDGSAGAITNRACAQAGGVSVKEEHVQDVFGILTNGNQWAIYRYQHGSPDVVYEAHALPLFMGPKHNCFASDIQKLLSSVVGILSYQVRARRSSGAMTRAKRRRDAATSVESRHVGAGHLQDDAASKRARLAI